MKKPAIFSLLLAALPYLCAQTLKDEDLHVYITRTISLFATHVSDFNDLHFANIWAVYVAEDGKKGEWLTLKNGGANVVNRDRHGEFIGARDVMLDWQYALF